MNGFSGWQKTDFCFFLAKATHRAPLRGSAKVGQVIGDLFNLWMSGLGDHWATCNLRSLTDRRNISSWNYTATIPDPQTLHGTATYAAPLTPWHHPNVSIYGSPMECLGEIRHRVLQVPRKSKTVFRPVGCDDYLRMCHCGWFIERCQEGEFSMTSSADEAQAGISSASKSCLFFLSSGQHGIVTV